jgi:hypothetical protein
MSRDRPRYVLVTRCAHCKVAVDENAGAITAIARRLQDHLLGCPAALAACLPALPLFPDEAELVRQFVVEHALGSADGARSRHPALAAD